MLFLYAALGGFLPNGNKIPVPWVTIALSVIVYVRIPLVTGYYSRKFVVGKKGLEWFTQDFVPYLGKIEIVALLITSIVLFALRVR